MRKLANIAWRFDRTDYPTSAEFDQDISDYQAAILEEQACWNPAEVVVDHPAVEIAYEYWVTSEEAVFADEMVIHDWKEQKEVTATFTADNGKYFTALEMLYKLHQRLRHRELGDHIFFEGLAAEGDSDKQEPPLFYLRCGS